MSLPGGSLKNFVTGFLFPDYSFSFCKTNGRGKREDGKPDILSGYFMKGKIKECIKDGYMYILKKKKKEPFLIGKNSKILSL